MRKPEKLSSGRWKVRFRHDGRQSSETFDTQREAADFAKWLDALGSQGALDRLYEAEQQASVPTLDTLAGEWIALRPNTTEGTRLNYERLWARTWGPLIGHTPANRLDEDDLARAVMTLGQRYSRKSLENQRGLLSGVMDRGVRKGYLNENYARGMPLPSGTHGDHAEMRVLTPEEFASIEAKIPDHYLTFVRTLYGTGMRWGEAVALEVRDWRKPNLHIRRALKWSPDNRREIGPPKTVSGRRTIHVTDELHAELDALTTDRPGDALVFTAPKGGAILHRTFWSRVWLPAVGHLQPRPRLHDLRHSHASLLLGRNVPPHVVGRRLGHSSIQVTVNVYGHLMPDAQMLAAQASSFAFNPRELG